MCTWREKHMIASGKGSHDRSLRSRQLIPRQRGTAERREKEMQIFARARDEYTTNARGEHCRLAGCRRPRRIRSVSFESARCVWLTSRPSWPLEGGRPPGGPPITRPVSATRTRPRSVIPSSTFERRSCTTPSRAAPSEERPTSRVTSHRRKSGERPGPRVPTAGDRIMFRYLYDARSTSRTPSSSSHPWRVADGEERPRSMRWFALTLWSTRLNRRLHSGNAVQINNRVNNRDYWSQRCNKAVRRELMQSRWQNVVFVYYYSMDLAHWNRLRESKGVNSIDARQTVFSHPHDAREKKLTRAWRKKKKPRRFPRDLESREALPF